jgi:gliding motility-associated lipoprotein GldD
MRSFNPKNATKVFGIRGLFWVVLLLACSREDPQPRPYGYAKAVLPERAWGTWSGKWIPAAFEFNAAACSPLIVPQENKDGSTRGEGQDASRWLNLVYADLGATLHLSYHPVRSVSYSDGRRAATQDALAILMSETQRMTFKHALKASAIQEYPLSDSLRKVFGMLYTVQGNAASQTQFYATDSVRHYLRGSLYFTSTPNSDSLAPYTAYLLQDLQHLLASLRWVGP